MNHINDLSNSLDVNPSADEGESNSIQTTSDHQIISVEEPTVSCQLVRETSYTEAEGMDYQQLHDCIAVNDNPYDVTFSQTEPVPSNPPLNSYSDSNRHQPTVYYYTQRDYVMFILIVMFFVVNVEPASNNTPFVMEDTQLHNMAMQVNWNNTHPWIKQNICQKNLVHTIDFKMTHEIRHGYWNTTIQNNHDNAIQSLIILDVPLPGETLVIGQKIGITIEDVCQTKERVYLSNEYIYSKSVNSIRLK